MFAARNFYCCPKENLVYFSRAWYEIKGEYFIHHHYYSPILFLLKMCRQVIAREPALEDWGDPGFPH